MTMVACGDDGLPYRCLASDATFAAASGDTVGLALAQCMDHGTAMAMAESAQHARCECCGLVEECTKPYMDRVCSLFCGHFICGLCAEAVKEEQWQASKAEGIAIAIASALQRHMAVCLQFNCNVRQHPSLHVKMAAAAMRQLLLRRIAGTSPSQP